LIKKSLSFKESGRFYGKLDFDINFIKSNLKVGIIFATIYSGLNSPSLQKRRGWGMSYLNRKMNRVSNLKLRQAAKELSRDLRKSQTRAEKFFLENARKKRFHGLKF